MMKTEDLAIISKKHLIEIHNETEGRADIIAVLALMNHTNTLKDMLEMKQDEDEDIYEI